MYLNSADGLVSQIVHHLVNAHLVSEVFAMATFRHLVGDHPISDLLTPHFKGLVNINTVGFEKLTSPDGAITQVTGFGHSGLMQLVKLAYEDWNYEKMSFLGDLEVSINFDLFFFNQELLLDPNAYILFTEESQP